MTCDQCDRPATWSATAAYRSLNHIGHAHPRWAVYPAPLAHACAEHLLHLLDADQASPYASRGYLVQPVRLPAG